MHITQVMSVVHLHVHFFRISDTAGRIAPKFGKWLETHYPDCFFTKVRVGAQLHVRTRFSISETARQIALQFCMWLKLNT